MKNKKLAGSVLAAVITLVTLVIGATYAYFTVATTNSFGTRTATATTESVGSVILKTGTNLSLTVTRVQMLQSNAGETYYAVGSTTNAGVLGTAEVLGEGNYSCTYTLNVALSGTMLDSVTSKGSTILYINDTAYDIYDYKTSKSITIDGSLIGISELISRNITGNIAIINKNSSQNSELAGKTVTASITASNFKCTTGEDITMLSGNEQVWDESTGDTLAFRSSALLSDFEEVRINDEVLDEDNYTLASGSTIVTLKKEYIKSLPSGSHEILIVSKTGGASASFTVGEQNGPVLLNQKIMSLVGETVGYGTVINENGYRYSGSNPNNYITFNNETWRIIGIVDGYVKIIRNDYLGTFSWDYKENGVGSAIGSYEAGSNDWTDSQLMMMLNPTEYLKKGYTINNDMVYDPSGNLIYQNMGSYYNRTIGYKPSPIAAGYLIYDGPEVNFSATGLNATARSLIQENVWYLSSPFGGNVRTADGYYHNERSGQYTYGENPVEWRGKVGLMYLSDYYYANYNLYSIDFDFNSYDFWSTGCDDNWICKEAEWTMAPSSEYVMIVQDNGVDDGFGISVSGEFSVRPVLYLKSGIKVTGTGNINSKYQIVS